LLLTSGYLVQAKFSGIYPLKDSERMSLTHMAKPDSVYELKLSLACTALPVWRIVHVPSAFTLHKLHTVIQAAMGWEDYHLYRFAIDDTEYGEPDPYEMLSTRDSRRVWLGGEVKPGDTFTYEYDFGDSWSHEVRLVAIEPRERGTKYPQCIGGERACPPEDCGGTHGYFELLEALHDPAHPEHESYCVWVGGAFDPEAFDLRQANVRR